MQALLWNSIYWNEEERDRRCEKRIGNKTKSPRQKREYATNLEKKKEASRNNARESKHDSDANISKFYAETEFGPEFICIC